MLTIINNDTDPLYNLAIEEYVLKYLNINEDILLLWQNRDSVIVGKNQNPFRDVNTPFTHENKIPMYRRLTEGESIFTDLGTINFSFIVKNPKDKLNDYNLFLNPLVELLNDLGVPSHLEKEGDLCLEGLRVAANTQSFHRNKMIHHGVLFFNTNLDKLDHALEVRREDEFGLEKEKVKHMGITNIKEYLNKPLTINQFKKLIIEQYIDGDLKDNQYKLDYIDQTKIKKIAKEKYATWDWNFGESPEFIIKREYENRMMITLIVDKGIIKRVSIDSFENVIALVKGLEGSKFNEKSLKERLQICTTINIDKFINTILY